MSTWAANLFYSRRHANAPAFLFSDELVELLHRMLFNQFIVQLISSSLSLFGWRIANRQASAVNIKVYIIKFHNTKHVGQLAGTGYFAIKPLVR